MTKPEEFVKCNSNYNVITYYGIARSHKEAVKNVHEYSDYWLTPETAQRMLNKRKNKRLSVYQVDEVNMSQYLAKKL